MKGIICLSVIVDILLEQKDLVKWVASSADRLFLCELVEAKEELNSSAEMENEDLVLTCFFLPVRWLMAFQMHFCEPLFLIRVSSKTS